GAGKGDQGGGRRDGGGGVLLGGRRQRAAQVRRHAPEPLTPVDRPPALQRTDWSLHRKGRQDARRHAEKVKEAIKESLPQVVAEEAIITAAGDTVVKVPIRSLELPRFRYDFGRNRHVGQGDGDSQAGQSVNGPGKGQGAGHEPGVDY